MAATTLNLKLLQLMENIVRFTVDKAIAEDFLYNSLSRWFEPFKYYLNAHGVNLVIDGTVNFNYVFILSYPTTEDIDLFEILQCSNKSTTDRLISLLNEAISLQVN